MSLSLTPLTFVIALLMGGISAYLAHRRGRNPYGWFVIGFLFGLVGLITIFFISQKKGAQKEAASPEGIAPLSLPKILGPTDKFWYYLDTGENQQGPMSFEALSKAFGQGKISATTFVWHEDLPDWKPLQEFIESKTSP